MSEKQQTSNAMMEERRESIALCLSLARQCAEVQLYPSHLLKEVCLSEDCEDERMVVEAGRSILATGGEAADGPCIMVADALAVRRLEVVLDTIFRDVGGYAVAKKYAEKAEERKYGGESPASKFSYGEIGPSAFVRIFRLARRRLKTSGSRLVFCDLGSGRGSTVFLAALASCDCNVESRGIELVPELHAMAEKAKMHFQSKKNVSFFQGDLLDLKSTWLEADVVFSNWICFDRHLITQLTIAAEDMKTGSILVTFTTAAQSPAFEVTDKLLFPKMPWAGPCTVFIHRKLSKAAIADRLKIGANPTPYDNDQAIATNDQDEGSMDSLDVVAMSSASSLQDDASFFDTSSPPAEEEEEGGGS